MLDRSASTPFHHQVRQFILHRVEAGDWPVGTRIPSEQELCALFGVSRATVGRALTDLVRQGVLDRQQGRGTFVASPRLLHGPFELKSFTEEHEERGLRAQAEVLACEELPALEDVATALRIAPGSPVARLYRLRYAGQETMGLQESFLPLALAPDIARLGNLLTGSLYQLLQTRYAIIPHRAIETFEPVLLDDTEAALLRCQDRRLAFLVERTTFDATGRAFEFVRSKMRGDRYRYTMELVRG
jgi:GntR family transcriptional regulator